MSDIHFKKNYNMINCRFNTKTNFLEVVYSGLISTEDLNLHGNKIMNNIILPRKLNILTDARNAEYDYKNINFSSMMKKMKKHLEPFLLVKNAILHFKPIETAISMIIENKIIIKNYQQKVFYTEEAAINWLNK